MASRASITEACARAPLASTTFAPAVPFAAQLDHMIAVQMAAYPDHWTSAEKREMAEQHLFGREVRRDQ